MGDSAVALQNEEKERRDRILTKPQHTPEILLEKMRIYKKGGETREEIMNQGTSRIYQRGRVYPGLKVSRSLGDILAHHIGVKSEPNVVVQEIRNTDKFVTIATQNVWKMLSADMVGDLVTENYGKKDPMTTTNMLCNKLNDLNQDE